MSSRATYEPTEPEIRFREVLVDMRERGTLSSWEDDLSIIYGNQRKPEEDEPFLTLSEILDEPRGFKAHFEVIDDQDGLRGVLSEGREVTLSCQVKGSSSTEILRALRMGLQSPTSRRLLREKGLGRLPSPSIQTVYDEENTRLGRRATLTQRFSWTSKRTLEVECIEEVKADVDLEGSKDLDLIVEQNL